MEWQHEASSDWLMARRYVITATELIGLRTGFTKLTKAQKAGDQLAPAFAALYGQKACEPDVDPMSYGAAARGHIMEPYAVEDFNAANGTSYHHWDDCIICNGPVGFSPDALDCRQPENRPVTLWHDQLIATSMLEIKSYSTENHMKNLTLPSNQVKERWQVAAAMLVLPDLWDAYIVFYAPQLAEYSMYYHYYTRQDLAKEIAELEEILQVWQHTVDWFEDHPSEMEARHTEQEIHEEYLCRMQQQEESIIKLSS